MIYFKKIFVFSLCLISYLHITAQAKYPEYNLAENALKFMSNCNIRSTYFDEDILTHSQNKKYNYYSKCGSDLLLIKKLSVPNTKKNKETFIEKIVNSNIKLCFKISKDFNLTISYF
jgi:hypothetical protein